MSMKCFNKKKKNQIEYDMFDDDSFSLSLSLSWFTPTNHHQDWMLIVSGGSKMQKKNETKHTNQPTNQTQNWLFEYNSKANEMKWNEINSLLAMD